MGANKYWARIVGTGLVCGALLVYQILSARILGVVIEPSLIIFTISVAMLGMGVATSLMSLRARGEARMPVRLGWLAAGLGLSYIAVFAMVVHLNEGFNAALESAVDLGGRRAYIAVVLETLYAKMGVVGAILFIPYFLFGLFIAELFATAEPDEYHRLYASDLVGAAAGCILAVLSLDQFGFPGCLTLILSATFAGACAFAFASGGGRVAVVNALAALGALAGLGLPAVYAPLEPKPMLSALARNFDRSALVETGWHTWNSHSRIGLLTLTDPAGGNRSQVYAHENGNGWARVPDFDVPDLVHAAPLAQLTTMFAPKRVLVLFAGVGDDMVAIDADGHGAIDISGVEINRDMVDHAISSGDPRLREFLSRPNIHLNVAEAREFLARDRSKYDAILLSWRGAGTSHYIGSSGFLSQYLYTKEAFASLIDHLNENGIIVLYNGSKAQTLATLSQLYRDRGLGPLSADVAILRARSKGLAVEGVFDVLEEMRLVLKPSGFSAPEMAILRDTAERLNSHLILSPDGAMPGFDLYENLASGRGLSRSEVDHLRNQDVEISVVTDDRPFINQMVPRANFLNISAWFDGKSSNYMWIITRGFIQFSLVLSLLSIIFILGPLFLRAGPRRSWRNVSRLFYFAVLGGGFMAIEIGMVRKLGLILGHPSYAISVVLAALILSAGLGSLASRRIAQTGLLGERSIAALIALYVVAFTACYPVAVTQIIGLPIFIKACISVAVLFPVGFLMGQLFPLGLERAGRDDPRLVPWAWAINGTSSTIGSAFAFLLSFPFGFDAILYFGALIYGVILVLPLDERLAVPGAAPVAAAR